MAESGRPGRTWKAGRSDQPASPSLASLTDLVARAGDILARETAARPPGVGARAGRPPLGRLVAPLDGLRQRAGEAVTDLMSALSSTAWSAGGSSNASVPWVRDQVPRAPGETATVGLAFENCGDRPELVSFYCTELLADAGYNIASYQVAFDPPSQTLAPQSQGRVGLKIDVPLQALPGCYSGLVQAVGLPATKAIITIEVK